MKRGWGYESGKLVTGRTCHGVCICVRKRDPIRTAIVVCGCLIGAALLLAAAIAFGGTL